MPPLNTANSLATNFNQVNKLAQNVTNDQQVRIIKDETGTRRVLLGKGSNGFYGLKTSPASVDVYTATAAQLSFSSDTSFTVLVSGTFTFPSASVTSGTPVYATSQVIAHNANFIPGVSCFAPLQVGNASLPVYPPDFPATLTTFIPNGGLIYQLGLAYMAVYYGVNSSNLYLGMSYINDTGSTLTISGAPITYYVYTYKASGVS